MAVLIAACSRCTASVPAATPVSVHPGIKLPAHDISNGLALSRLATLAFLPLRMPSTSAYLPLFLVLGIAARIECSSPLPRVDGVENSTGRIHYIHVGEEGLSAFNPSTVGAEAGDSVRFELNDLIYRVSQSMSIVQPCTLAEPGFRSPTGDFVFTINVNDTKPILVHSEPHCSLGMVMIINPANPSDIAKMTRIASQGSEVSPLAPESAFPLESLVGSPSESVLVPPPSSSHDAGALPTFPSRESTSSTVAHLPPASSSTTSGAKDPEIQPSAARNGSPSGHPLQGARKDLAAALATALTLSVVTLAGACYMWRRWRRRTTSTVRVDALALLRQQASERTGAMIAEHPTGDEFSAAEGSVASFQRQATSGTVEWKHKRFDGGGPISPISNATVRGGGGINVEPTPMTLLRAELDRVLAENEMLRQRAEPPAYSDGARSELGAP